MHAHRADRLAVLQSHVAPRLAAVDRLINAVAVRSVAAHAGFAHAGVDHVGVGIGHGNRAHGAGLQLPVGNRQPRAAAIGGFPNASAHAAEVVNVGLRRHAGYGHHAAATVRSYQAEPQVPKQIRLLGYEEQRKSNQQSDTE